MFFSKYFTFRYKPALSTSRLLSTSSILENAKYLILSKKWSVCWSKSIEIGDTLGSVWCRSLIFFSIPERAES